MLKYLIVDDSKSARMKLESILRPFGKCRMAKDGLEAVELVKSALDKNLTYDLVLMDIEMPAMDGHTALKRIQDLQMEKGVPEDERMKAIMVSSRKGTDDIMQAHYEEGAAIYITKPFEDETVIEALANLGIIDQPMGDDGEEDEECSRF